MPKKERESTQARGLNPVESEFVRFFVHFASTLSLPRSVGEIFGYLFAADSPRAFDEIVTRLGISKGSASQGLRFLVKIGAIGQVYIPRDRRTFYEAETRMRKLFGNALKESVRPQLETNGCILAEIEQTITSESDSLGKLADHYRHRASSLRGWNEKALTLLPLFDKLFSLPASLLPFDFLFGSGSGESDRPSGRKSKGRT